MFGYRLVKIEEEKSNKDELIESYSKLIPLFVKRLEQTNEVILRQDAELKRLYVELLQCKCNEALTVLKDLKEKTNDRKN